MDTPRGDGTYERPSDAGSTAKRWKQELELAAKEEKHWRQDAAESIKRYRNDEYTMTQGWHNRRGRVNVLWSNTETMMPAVYSRTPKPIVKRRYYQDNPVAGQVSLVMQRSLEYVMDAEQFDDAMKLCRWDYLLPSRCVLWVRYEPDFVEERIAYERVWAEHVQWDDFRHGPGRTWDEVPWVARRHRMTREQLVEKFGQEIGDELPLDSVPEHEKDKGSDSVDNSNASIFARAVIWEIWDKDARKVCWLSESWDRDTPALVQDDPLKLDGFFPCAEPGLSVRTSNTLVPVTLFSLYCDQASELDRVSQRISLIVSAMRVRGIYDGTIVELSRLMDSDDNEYIAAQNVTALIERGGLEKAIWTMPIGQLANVLQTLYQQRNEIKQVIYEITGMADIIRGSSQASETATAQEIKSKYAGLRIGNHQQEIQRFARDTIRIMAEVIAELFQPQTLSLMTSVQVTPEMIGMMRNEKLRCFNVDVETDSTIAEEMLSDRKDVTELLAAIGQFVTMATPAVENGIMTIDVAKELMMAGVRRFKLGSELEGALSKIGHGERPPNPDAIKAQQESQMEQTRLQADMQFKQLEFQQKQAEMQADQQKQQFELQKQQLEIQREQIRLDIEKIKAQSELVKAQAAVIGANAGSDTKAAEPSDKSGEALGAGLQAVAAAMEKIGGDKQVVRDPITQRIAGIKVVN